MSSAFYQKILMKQVQLSVHPLKVKHMWFMIKTHQSTSKQLKKKRRKNQGFEVTLNVTCFSSKLKRGMAKFKQFHKE